jgi:hypothetical protein
LPPKTANRDGFAAFRVTPLENLPISNTLMP